MCEIAPFQMKCENEKYDLTCCKVHKLMCAWTELMSHIPIVRLFYPDYYRCPDFDKEV